MKKLLTLLFAASLIFIACNNETEPEPKEDDPQTEGRAAVPADSSNVEKPVQPNN